MSRISDPHWKLKVIVSVAVAVAIAARLIWPTLTIDTVVLGLIVVGVLPWLAPIIKSIKVGPSSLEVELHELKQKTDEAKGAAESARQRAEFALTQSSPVPAIAETKSVGPEAGDHWQTQAGKLVEEYNTLRRDSPAGWDRTSKMAGIVKRMIQLSYQHPNWDVTKHLEHTDRGWRLMAYAWLNALPDFRFLHDLAEKAYQFRDDNKPFGQYWSILAIQRVIGARGSQPVSKDTKKILQTFFAGLEPGTDRHYELKRVIESINSN